MAHAYNAAQEQLRDVLTHVVENARVVAASADELSLPTCQEYLADDAEQTG